MSTLELSRFGGEFGDVDGVGSFFLFFLPLQSDNPWHLVCHMFWSATKIPTDKSYRIFVSVIHAFVKHIVDLFVKHIFDVSEIGIDM